MYISSLSLYIGTYVSYWFCFSGTLPNKVPLILWASLHIHCLPQTHKERRQKLNKEIMEALALGSNGRMDAQQSRAAARAESQLESDWEEEKQEREALLESSLKMCNAVETKIAHGCNLSKCHHYPTGQVRIW